MINKGKGEDKYEVVRSDRKEGDIDEYSPSVCEKYRFGFPVKSKE